MTPAVPKGAAGTAMPPPPPPLVRPTTSADEPQRKSLLAVGSIPFSDSWEDELATFLEERALINDQVVVQDVQGVECPWWESTVFVGVLLEPHPSSERFPLKVLLKRMSVVPVMSPATEEET